MSFSFDVDKETGRPIDDSYLESDLPKFLTQSIRQMVEAWEKLDKGEEYYQWDLDWCELNADINSCEIDQLISPVQANYLRKKYLKMNNKEDL